MNIYVSMGKLLFCSTKKYIVYVWIMKNKRSSLEHRSNIIFLKCVLVFEMLFRIAGIITLSCSRKWTINLWEY